MALLYLWVQIKAQQTPPPQEGAKEKFWQWAGFTNYLLFVCSIAAATGLATIFLGENRTYQTMLGLLSSGVEAMLGAPQFLLNYQRQNTSGLSIVLILIWLWGDVYKLSYYIGNSSPVALQACSSFQILTDLLILG